MERTLILVKPDAFARNLTGEIIARFERKGLRLAALKQMTMTPRAGRAALRRARRQAVLRRARRLHHLRSAGGDGAGGRVGDHRRAPGDRRHEPARGEPGLDPRRLRRRGRARTWSTARTRRSPPRARPACSSRTSERHAAALILASRSPQRRAILAAAGIEFTVAGARGAGADRGRAGGDRGRERAAQGRARSPRPRVRAGARRRHRRGVRGAGVRQAGRRAARPARRSRRSAGRTHTVISGVCLRGGGRGAHRGGPHRGPLPRARAGAARLVPGHRRVARASRRLRDPGPRRGARDRGSRATT